MSFEIVTDTMGSGMMASKEMVGSQKSQADLNKPTFSCDPGVARKIAKGILNNCKRTVILEPRALPGRLIPRFCFRSLLVEVSQV